MLNIYLLVNVHLWKEALILCFHLGFNVKLWVDSAATSGACCQSRYPMHSRCSV